MMSAPIQLVASAAHRLFSRLNPMTGNFKEQAKDLISLVNKISATDVDFKWPPVKKTRIKNFFGPPSPEAPAAYIHLWEDDIMTIGIFVLKPGCSIPLHDHPNMNGMCKVIHGTVGVRSFTCVDNKNPTSDLSKKGYISTIMEDNREYNSEDNCCVLMQDKGNIHEIYAINGAAAFLDILAPPYDHETNTRVCQYYKESDIQDKSSANLHWLQKVPSPDDFWCDPITYTGPMIDL